MVRRASPNVTDAKISLDEAIAGAEKADRYGRIEWRDAIADYGPAGIDAVFDWVGDAEFGLFAVKVMEAVGKRGWTPEALDALTSLRSIGASDAVRREAEAVMQRLRPGAPPHAAFRQRARVPSTGGVDWPGFQPQEFRTVDGTTWRRSTDSRALIPLLLRPLLDLDRDFHSYPIYRLPEVHFANRDRYEQGGEHKQGWRASKLVVYANGSSHGVDAHVAVGYYVEKGTGADEFGPVDRAHWDWPRFVELLRDPSRRRLLEAAFAAHDLRVGDYIGGRFDPSGALVQFVGRLEDGALVMRRGGAEIARGWDDLADTLEALPDGEWHDLHVWRQWPAEEAIAAGHPFAVSVMLAVLLDLARIYESVIGYAGR
jgi:hypothetical protein